MASIVLLSVLYGLRLFVSGRLDHCSRFDWLKCLSLCGAGMGQIIPVWNEEQRDYVPLRIHEYEFQLDPSFGDVSRDYRMRDLIKYCPDLLAQLHGRPSQARSQ
jgi:hypothetical protein